MSSDRQTELRPDPRPPSYRSDVGSIVHHSCRSLGEDRAVLPKHPTVGLVHRGVGVLRLHRREVRVDESQTVLLHGGSLHVRHLDCAGASCATTFDLSAAATQVLARRCRVPLFELQRLFENRPSMRSPAIQRQAHVLIQAAGACRGGSDRDADERLLELFVAVVAIARQEPPPARSWRADVEQVRLLISTRMEDPPRLDELASAVGCSPFHLCRVFKQEMGLTMNQYLHRLRLHRAVLRLSAGPQDLSTLAVELGYASHSHFTHRFRRCYGITPSAFRKEVERVGLGGRRPAISSGTGARRSRSTRLPGRG